MVTIYINDETELIIILILSQYKEYKYCFKLYGVENYSIQF